MALEPGIERVDEFTVEGRLITDVGGTIGASVLSTPGMIGMMERTSAILSYSTCPRAGDRRLRGLHQARRRGRRGRRVPGPVDPEAR